MPRKPDKPNLLFIQSMFGNVFGSIGTNTNCLLIRQMGLDSPYPSLIFWFSFASVDPRL
uniref:Uncharacterized protein n=1 Tax=Picea glauca TaxID=3330 RepID=A0A101M0I9_PICGL|nr:hypothetical protein ABT39_MTgene4120 [Picea glauca]QHR92568.1 hypothetical protein Q903MT_gene6614 [Picea sitchensis]